jgi:hypothetical protein
MQKSCAISNPGPPRFPIGKPAFLLEEFGRGDPVFGYPARVVSADDRPESESLRARGEEALGELAQALVDNPVFSGALARALGAGERAASAQRQAIGALNLAAAADVERLEQRLRSFSARLEAIEDQLDDLSAELAAARRSAGQGGDAATGDD